MEGFSRVERAALADALAGAGPDAPTLCAGWTTTDLAAHLVVRERRPDAALGILVPPLAGWTRRAQNAVLGRAGYAGAVELVRQGPPRWSPFRIGPVAEAVNTVEFFVHHEDVRRAVPGWSPRELSGAMQDELWTRLRRFARLMFRQVPVGVTLVRTAGGDEPRRTAVARKAAPDMVTVTGQAAELLLFAYGRGSAAAVEFTGPQEAIARLRGARLGL